MRPMADQELFDTARKEFLSHLRYTKGHSAATCYSYHSDLGIWAAWLAEAGKDWQRVKAQDVSSSRPGSCGRRGSAFTSSPAA
jgi:site-specific recombinase XerD